MRTTYGLSIYHLGDTPVRQHITEQKATSNHLEMGEIRIMKEKSYKNLVPSALYAIIVDE